MIKRSAEAGITCSGISQIVGLFFFYIFRQIRFPKQMILSPFFFSLVFADLLLLFIFSADFINIQCCRGRNLICL